MTRQQVRYQKRKLAGLCCYGKCAAEVHEGRTLCSGHLRQMARQVSEMHRNRVAQKLCRDCGARPQFWGNRCVVCRQLLAKDPLPRGARQALRRYREAQAKVQKEKSREIVRVAARKYAAAGTLKKREAEALKLYLGLEDNGWRTYGQVAQLMNVSAERVRQLLLPAKKALLSSLAGKTRWRFTPNRKHFLPSHSWVIKETSSPCEHSEVKILRAQSVVYTAAGLSNVTLQALPVSQCTKCKVEECHIPRRAELHDMLAQALLNQSRTLSGQEIRFLRTVARMNAAEFAERLTVTRQTVQKWEARRVLRFRNESAARAILASLILKTDVSAETFRLPDMILSKDPERPVITAKWVETSGYWQLAS